MISIQTTHQDNIILSLRNSLLACILQAFFCYKESLATLSVLAQGMSRFAKAQEGGVDFSSQLRTMWENRVLKLEAKSCRFCLLLCILTKGVLLLSGGVSPSKSHSGF